MNEASIFYSLTFCQLPTGSPDDSLCAQHMSALRMLLFHRWRVWRMGKWNVEISSVGTCKCKTHPWNEDIHVCERFNLHRRCPIPFSKFNLSPEMRAYSVKMHLAAPHLHRTLYAVVQLYDCSAINLRTQKHFVHRSAIAYYSVNIIESILVETSFNVFPKI